MLDPTVSQPATEREPIHFDAGFLSQHAACDYDLDRNGPEGWTTDRAKVTCAPCASTLVDEQLAEPAPAAPVVEKRTVSLETLTPELRNPPVDPDVDPLKTIWIPEHARVGIVLRADGQLLAVVESDADWIRKHEPVALLSRLLQQAEHYARDGDAELLMPTPDVLAALDDTPNAALWTAPLVLRADQVKPGWLVLDFPGFKSAAAITAVGVSCDGGCMWSACVPVSADTEPVHLAPWQTLTVRIPAAVTA